MAAKYLPGQQKRNVFATRPRWRFFIFIHFTVDPLELFVGNNTRDSARYNYIVPAVFADILTIAKNARYSEVCKFFSAPRLYSTRLYMTQDFGNGISVVVHIEKKMNDFRAVRVYVEFVFFIHGITDRKPRTVELTFIRRFAHTARYLFPQFSGIIFGQTFQQSFKDNSFRAFGYVFFCV